MKDMLEVAVAPEQIEKAKQTMAKALQYFEDNLDGNSSYFIKEQLTYADIVAGTAVDAIPLLGIDLEPYPKVTTWLNNLRRRDSWQQTAPTPEQIETSKAVMKAILQKK